MKNSIFALYPDDLEDEMFEEQIKEEIDKERDKYCSWIFNKSTYVPATDVEIVNKVESGIYKINNDFALVKQTISSDGLYKLPNSEINLILDEVNKFWDKADKFKKHNLIHKRGILLEGPPGTGKSSIITLLIKELIEKYDGIVLLVNNINDFTKVYEFLKSTFRRIEPNRFVITIIEDINKICTPTIESEVLDFFDGKASISNHLIITTSNDTSDLPDALLRVSRIDRKFYIGYPSEKARREYFINKGVDESLIQQYIDNSENLTLSELKELFIGTYILDNDFEDVVEQIINPYEKKEHSSRNIDNNKIEID